MIAPLDRRIATAALVSVAFGLSACGGGSPNPPAPQPASVHRTTVSAAAFACLRKPCLYVANFYALSATIYQQTAKGNVAPLHTIAGSNTGLHGPYGIAVDANHKAYIVNTNGGSQFTGSLTVYAAGANGNVAPMQTITGSNTGLAYPFCIALDSSNDLYVTNYNGQSVTVYAAGANGNVAPIRTISGSNTGLNEPFGIAVRGTTMYVANESNSTVTVYGATANGNVSPIRTIGGSNTGLNGPTGIAIR
jgi:6-phosphogluconolactonase (cycloisomerase 2 family)